MKLTKEGLKKSFLVQEFCYFVFLLFWGFAVYAKSKLIRFFHGLAELPPLHSTPFWQSSGEQIWTFSLLSIDSVFRKFGIILVIPTIPGFLISYCNCKIPPRSVRQGVSTDSRNFHWGPPIPTLLCPVGGPPPKRLYGRFWDGPLAGRASCGRLLPPWIPPAVRAW
jgi:hypothetical protein